LEIGLLKQGFSEDFEWRMERVSGAQAAIQAVAIASSSLTSWSQHQDRLI